MKLSQNQYDVVNTHIGFFDTVWWGWLYAKIIGAKSIFTEHVATFPTHPNTIVRLVAKALERTLTKWTVKQYNLVTVTNKAGGDFISRNFGVKRYSLVYGGVATDYFKPLATPQAFRKIPKVSRAFNKTDLIITYIGRVIVTKGVLNVYEAFKNLCQEYPNAFLTIAGSGSQCQELQKRVEADHLGMRVFVVGNLNYDDVMSLLGVSDIFVNVSMDQEGLPNNLLEAGSSGVAIVATDVGGVKEIILNNETGLLIPQKDNAALASALETLLSNPDLRQRLGTTARNYIVAHFDWAKISEEFYKVLVSITKDPLE